MNYEIDIEEVEKLKSHLEEESSKALSNGKIEEYTNLDLDLSVVKENLESQNTSGFYSDKYGLLEVIEKYKGSF